MIGIYDSLQRLDLRENSNLLEVCIGPGVGLEEALRYQGVKVIGVDVSKDMVELSSSKIAQHIQDGRAKVVLGDVHNLSFIESNSIDRIFHMNCCYFWEDVEQALKELLRVLKPGGKMLSAMKYRAIKKGNHDPAIFKNTDPESYLKSLEKVGFVNIESSPVQLQSGCTGINAKLGCPVSSRMHYTAVFSSKTS
ncbi:hypothetical protein GUITHDRAFT_101373 [Guillardia theta CCMP2712]|uniref:Methyltransferase type 11 domain-containing protein n=1 Tax=Guillardia theta (strain CCMP2712) TaxID=905079 RepID=L1JXV5_GUITC|nr:hypothetical protein GUITHDRAFT_101373 [Guillardia theta CCMP2712]EKX52923.1 hypothetical protein GUITHDRAFT_101373 [Guillardia theta CCMP2712]|eukprot:XP_005839903.1 hypothetical protein GUITHDRAFT_101373 [Guillardia theta CCMP2712]